MKEYLHSLPARHVLSISTYWRHVDSDSHHSCGQEEKEGEPLSGLPVLQWCEESRQQDQVSDQQIVENISGWQTV